MSPGEYVIDGARVNALLASYQIESSMLPGQVFKIVEEKMVKALADEIQKANPQTIRFVNLEAIRAGPYAIFLYAICGGLCEITDIVIDKKITVDGEISDPYVLPWNLVGRIRKDFKGAEGPREVPRE